MRGLGKEREESERVGKRKRGDIEGWEEKERSVGKRKRGE